jgi:hypothetical protein
MSKEQDNLAQREKVVKRGVAALTALSLMATGCVAVEGGQVMAKIADEPTKTSPLSLDFTKTPISSPTDVNYELTPTIVNPVTQELTLVSPTEVTTEMPTLTLTPEPTATVNPETETVDEELAEKIKSFMPKMWVYNSVSKSFEVRNPNEFSFLISKRTKLLISDKEGNEVGFAKYFNKNSLDSQATVYYSLTDKSIDTLIPLKLYSQMGEYDEPILTSHGDMSGQKCMYGFVHGFDEEMLNFFTSQKDFEQSQKYTSNLIFNKEGDDLLQTAILRSVANIKGVDESRLVQDIKKGILIEIETKLGNWVVNKGMDFYWNDAMYKEYKLNDGKLLLFDGVFTGDQLCHQGSLGMSLYSFLSRNFNENFPEVVKIYNYNLWPYNNAEKYTNIRLSPVVVGLRDN